MTRPMPGPPDALPPVHDLSRPPVGPDGQFDWDTWRRWREQDEREWRAIQAKRLTDAECAAEFWRAEGDHCLASEGYDIDWFSGDLLRDEDIACDVHATWHRFATRPHALDAT